MQYLIGVPLSILLILLSIQDVLPVELGLVEALAVVSYAWSVWLLAKNRPAGWWVGLVGCALYGAVFFNVRLYAEVLIQIFYFITSVQAIYIWLRGGENRTERLVGRVPLPWLIGAGVAIVAGTLVLRHILIELRGAAPFWDALTTVLSITAHLFLMGRFVESWYLWITVDVIYVPLYASRELYVTSILYAIFLGMATNGLRNFRRAYRDRTSVSVEVEGETA
jgi:nicotinamide mononucleotide transporter